MPQSKKDHILAVDDCPDTLEIIRRNLSSKKIQVTTARSVTEALKILDSAAVDLVVTDLKMPGTSGLDLIRHIRENHRNTEVMMITGYASVEGAVEAVKTGAEEYLAKPFTDGELSAAVQRALDKLHMRRTGQYRPGESLPSKHGLIGNSEVMKKVAIAVDKAASTLATVLITGESGTGKELVARAIHYSSRRAPAPFVPVNCGGIPEGLLESELFGHVRGAFTGATESRAGFFQTAEGGTIFLDEISETSPAMQVKLLRALQDKAICMVGATRTQKVDVRIIAATNKDLTGLTRRGIFREDLFFRLNVISIEVPPLRKREDDVLLLVNYFKSKFASEFGKREIRFTDRALASLTNYAWPGNVRELENIIQRIVVMSDSDTVDVSDLPSFMRFTVPHKESLTRTLTEVEAEYISNVLSSTGGNKAKAARILGIDRKTLREKLKAIPAK
ncbi:MAG: sigma-54 dependent transcriptional regulator [Kiritimatiellae bacterium]|nr:sigma-54 dependent transcriptional regulator [Kiritimatiellia bacterium]MDD5522804.1 sigma-54 dependent transcriptional regulator [Kiritimatiellia bacterium]